MLVNHYDTLGLNRDAKQHQIKKAYHKLALKWHPDKNHDQHAFALSQFHKISEAYQTLSKLEHKIIYDCQLSHYESINDLFTLFKQSEQKNQNNDFKEYFDTFLTDEEQEILKQFKKKINEQGVSKKIRKFN